MQNDNITVKYTIEGLVQGVGYRPFVALLAETCGITGWVRNTAGIVTIMASGTREVLTEFEKKLNSEKPKASRVDQVERQEVESCQFETFQIVESEAVDCGILPRIPADLPTCSTCVEELNDPKNRRFRHPFISCTSCGPRYSILDGIPYDRENIVMDVFPMCPECEAEYVAKDNIRRHAQTIACHKCGPKLFWQESDYCEAKNQEDTEVLLQKAIAHLEQGGILALKDIGGYHLACLPSKEETVEALRFVKGREKKPFAVMFDSIDRIATYAKCNELEKKAMLSEPRPIVLLERQGETKEIVSSCCGKSPHMGAMLPCNPLQILLLQHFGMLIMTSANRSGELMVIKDEPMCSWAKEANALLERERWDVKVAVLGHDREIRTPLDDSVMSFVAGRQRMFRRGRGFVPEWISVPVDQPVFAAGGDLKACFCLADQGKAYLSQHLGDLEDEDSMNCYQKERIRLQSLVSIQPKRAVVDQHPGYQSVKLAEAVSKEQIKIQHHEAHVASVIAEHSLTGNVFGVAFDGTGYGTDGTIWGSEFFFWNRKKMKRVGHLKTTRLPGGNEGAKNALSSAYGYLKSTKVELLKNAASSVDGWDESKYDIVKKALEMGINSVASSSMGRLFDAVSAVLSICSYNSYEGEAPIELEYLAKTTEEVVPVKVPIQMEESAIIGEPTCVVEQALSAIVEGESPAKIARGFIYGIADYIVDTFVMYCECNHLSERECSVALGGGTFFNEILLARVLALFEKRGVSVYVNEKVPSGDGGICLGQAYLGCLKGD